MKCFLAKPILAAMFGALSLTGQTCGSNDFYDTWKLDISITDSSYAYARTSILDLSSGARTLSSSGRLTGANEVLAATRYSQTADAGLLPTCNLVFKSYSLLERNFVPDGKLISQLTLTLDPASGSLSGSATYLIFDASGILTQTVHGTIVGSSIAVDLSIPYFGSN